jgi:hypothetical protein
MIPTFYGQQMGAGNTRGHITSESEGNHMIGASMNHQCRRFHLHRQRCDIYTLHLPP